MKTRVEKTLHELGNGIFAYTQLPGSWGWSNAGLITDGDQSLLVDTLFDRKTTVEMLQPICEGLLNQPDEDLVKEITKVWDLEKYVIIMIKDILLYMDKNFVPKMKNYLSVEAMQTA